jgi:predicted metal-binding protein
MSRKSTKVKVGMRGSQHMEDLERYRKKSLELGASEAKIIKTKDIPAEEAVVLKCRIPGCYGYGICAHCPPHAPKPAELREYLKGYEWAILFIKYVPTELLLRDRHDKERRDAFRSIYDIVSKIEAMAFYDGYYLSFGFGAGSCKTTFCGPDKTCSLLEGEVCRFPYEARPSMEAVGINVFKMVDAAGWEIYPIGHSTRAEDIPRATLAGIVIIQ